MALAALLRLHNQAMNGGLLNAVTEACNAEQVDAALEGYRYFELNDAASVVAAVRSEAAIASEDELDGLEGDADRRYAAVVPTDGTLVSAFRTRAAAAPDAFAPTDG